MLFLVALFAVGLVVYLWDINRQVAVPVVAITSAFVLLYAAATVLPVASESCPYGTVLSEPFRVFILPPVLWFLAGVPGLVMLLLMIVLWFPYFILKCVGYVDLARQFHLAVGLLPDKFTRLLELLGLETDKEKQETEAQNEEVPMDIVTSRILGWLISHSENKNHVTIALQAISAASIEMPMNPLRKCGVEEQVSSQLLKCFSGSWGRDEHLTLKPTSDLKLASSYFRALSHLLVSDSSNGYHWDHWGMDDSVGWWIFGESLIEVYRL